MSTASATMLDQSKSGANSETARPATLPMYCLPEMEVANSAFLTALQRRLRARGIDADGPGILFTQICGYPLFKHYRDQYRMLATPHYAVPGCVGSSHRAFFMVRADDPAKRLEDLRGRIFG